MKTSDIINGLLARVPEWVEDKDQLQIEYERKGKECDNLTKLHTTEQL